MSCAGRCGGVKRTFSFDKTLAEKMRWLDIEVESTVALHFFCAHCSVQRLTFLVHVARVGEKRHISLFKGGQWPSDRPKATPELAAAMGDATVIYEHGLLLQQFGLGIGALSYYRRVTEEIIERLMTDLREFAVDSGATTLVKRIDKVAKEQQASKRIKAVKELLPSVLRPPGQANPLGVIYGVLSENMHERSDVECMADAVHLRTALEFILIKLRNNIEEKKRYAAALKNVPALGKAGKR